MQKLITATLLIAVATGASAHYSSNKHNMWHVKQALNPHANGTIAATNGGYKSWKERKRACHAAHGEYTGETGECKIRDNNGLAQIYYGDQRIPTEGR